MDELSDILGTWETSVDQNDTTSRKYDSSDHPDDEDELAGPDLYGVEEDLPSLPLEAKLTAKQRKALPASSFCGPNRSFPAHDKAHVKAGLSLLGRSKLSATQKARVRACLIRKGRKMGMKFSDKESAEFAVILHDARHNVRAGLLRLPSTAEEVDGCWTKIGTYDWLTADEELSARQYILRRIRRLDADKAERFSEGVEQDPQTDEPVMVELNESNYGLIYTAIEEDGRVWRDERVEEKTIEVEKIIEKVVEGEPSPDTLEKLVASQAELTALYETLLRRTSASVEDRQEQLKARGSEYLGFALEDLRSDWKLNNIAGAVAPEAATIPLVKDPSQDEDSDDQELIKIEPFEEEVEDSPVWQILYRPE